MTLQGEWRWNTDLWDVPASKSLPFCLGIDNYGFVTPEDEAIRMINRAIDAGIDLPDTANVYQSGPIIGKALARMAIAIWGSA